MKRVREPDASRFGSRRPRRRVRAHVSGTVQGVGFRPFVFRLVEELGLAGFIRNDEQGVLIEVEGASRAVDSLVARLRGELPPLAHIDALDLEELVPTGEGGFVIAASSDARAERLTLPALPEQPLEIACDSATCEDCLAELFDPRDRRYRYPFINCTNCGPRYTIIRSVPYDRPLTTMVGFAMCPACREEYESPADRRFHAQPNACPECGPRVTLRDGDGNDLFAGPGAVDAAVEALRTGRILAIKGLGGYHLVCRADDDEVVNRLRERKRRPHKPLALMVYDLEAADALVELSEGAEALLTHRARPIVLAPRLPAAELRGLVADAVAPGAPDLGVMLAYTPLHHLLVVDVGVPLVCTSGNRSGEPIVCDDGEALERLGGAAGVADFILGNDRPIQTRAEDSVLRAVELRGAAAVPLRRARGYVPRSLRLPRPTERVVLAVGAERKATFCLSRGAKAWLGPHIGDLTCFETLKAFGEGVAHLESLLDLSPTVIAHDRHPDYLSTAYASRRGGCGHIAVQHHHAHLAAVLAEHGEVGPALGAIFDGAGYGDDGTVWGGELLLGDLDGFERVGHLWPARLPGGDRAAREPWRMACAWGCLVEAGEGAPRRLRPLEGVVDEGRWHDVARLVRAELQAPITTSVGRLFDAVAAWCGAGAETSFEGQAAIALEALALGGRGALAAYPMPTVELGGSCVLDARQTVDAVLADVARGVDPEEIALAFHAGLAEGTTRALAHLAKERGVEMVALSGGVFQNRLLLERMVRSLEAEGLRVLVSRRVPPNDGGIAFGQAAVASSRLARADDVQ